MNADWVVRTLELSTKANPAGLLTRHDRTGPRVVRVIRAPRSWRSDVVAWVEGQSAE